MYVSDTKPLSWLCKLKGPMREMVEWMLVSDTKPLSWLCKDRRGHERRGRLVVSDTKPLSWLCKANDAGAEAIHAWMSQIQSL